MAPNLRIPTAEVFMPLLEQARYKGAWGGRGCLHPDALIDTPSGQIKVSEFKGGEVYSWHNGEVVVATATAAIEYTEEDLFEVVLADGRQIVATDQHKFLTQRGWVELADLSTFDEVVVLRGQDARDPLSTTSDACLSELRQDARHWTKKREDYLGDCSKYLRQYGQQLRSVVGSGQAFPPSQADELQHSCHALFHSDDLGFVGKCIPSFSFHHPSSHVFRPFLGRRYCEGLEIHGGEKISVWPSVSFRSPLLSRVKTCLSLPSQEWRWLRFLIPSRLKNLDQNPQRLWHRLQHIFLGNSSLSPSTSDDFTLSRVGLVRKHSRLKYWDLHVFGTNNYLSNGIVNHNSGKSHFFAGALVEDALRWPGVAGEGLRAACIREVQKSLKQSAKRLIEDKIRDFGLGPDQGFKVFREVIETPGDGLITFTGMQDHTADSVKSMEGFHRAWTEEAHSLSSRSMGLLRPTIRWEDKARGLVSELWFSWNPERPTDPVDQLLRGNKVPEDSAVVQANWSHNPWFPSVLEAERQEDLKHRPERYGHTWEGEYATVLDGAYFAAHLTRAALEDRIGWFPADDLMLKYAVWDIGATSGKSDAVSIWVVQFIGDEVRVLDYYEAVGQDFPTHVNWLRSNGYEKATCILPHDGVKHDTVYDVTPEGFLRKAGFSVEIVPNQGRGAAALRIDAVRNMFPQVRFNDEETKGGREALGWYHERIDEKRGIGLGPDHDWSSHAADSFGLVAVYRERVKAASGWGNGPLRRNLKGIA